LLFFFFFFGGIGVPVQCFVLAKQVFYNLSSFSSLFCSGYFADGGSHELFSWAGLEPWSSQFQPPKELGLQVWTLVPGFWSLLNPAPLPI
jgi:hypothetical protein